MNDSRLALSRMQLRDTFVMAETADIFVSNLSQFAETSPEQAAAFTDQAFVALEQAYGYDETAREERKPFVYQDGVAIIPIHGALLNRFGGSYSFATGYNYIRRTMAAAIADDDVQLIAFDVDSPGGEAAGCFELANEMREARDSKPMIAVVDSLSCSAGYALASATGRIYATPSSKIGSIGVVRMHMNMKGALDKMGLEITFIEAPEDGMKTAGNPYEKLGDSAKKEFQESVNLAYDDFVELIVANRGIEDTAVRETKARVYRADEALALRLIDEVKTPSQAVSSSMAELADDTDPDFEEEDKMSTATGKQAPAPAGTTEVTSAPSQDAITAAVNADRERMSAIKGLPEAADKPKLADTLALQGMSVEQSTIILKAAAPEVVEAAPAAAAPAAAAAPQTTAAPAVDQVNHLDAAMSRTAQPNVGAGGEGATVAATDAPKTDAELAASILGDQASVTGLKLVKDAA